MTAAVPPAARAAARRLRLHDQGTHPVLAVNYDADATADDGSCVFKVHGCMESGAFNYEPLAAVDDGSSRP